MTNILSNRMFQVGAAALVVAGIGYTFLNLSDSDTDANTAAEVSTTEQTETTQVSNTEATEANEATENTEISATNSTSSETVESTTESE